MRSTSCSPSHCTVHKGSPEYKSPRMTPTLTAAEYLLPPEPDRRKQSGSQNRRQKGSFYSIHSYRYQLVDGPYVRNRTCTARPVEVTYQCAPSQPSPSITDTICYIPAFVSHTKWIQVHVQDKIGSGNSITRCYFCSRSDNGNVRWLTPADPRHSFSVSFLASVTQPQGHSESPSPGRAGETEPWSSTSH